MRPKEVLFAGVLAMLILSCDEEDPDKKPGGSGPVTITSVQTGKFWGDELVITGTGFSNVKEENVVTFVNVKAQHLCEINYTSAGGDIRIVNASATQLTIVVPGWKPAEEYICGPTAADIEISVDGVKATSTGHTFGELPYLENFNYHYGWFGVPHVTRIGDSVMIRGGLRGSTQLQSPYWNDLRLTINGMNIPFKYRNIAGESGLAFYLSASDFGEINCSTDPDDWGAREMHFKLSIQGTNKSASRDLYVQYYPAQSAYCENCPSQLSKSAGGNPSWKVKGTNMSYKQAVFAQYACVGTPQSVTIGTASPWTDELQFLIPLSILSSGCTYSVTLTDGCRSAFVGEVSIVP